jgi:hypothetical protein
MLCLWIPFNDVVLKPLATQLTFLDQLDEKLAPLHDGEDPLLHVTSSGVSTKKTSPRLIWEQVQAQKGIDPVRERLRGLQACPRGATGVATWWGAQRL